MSLVFGSAIITGTISGDGIGASTPVLVATTEAGTLASSFQNGSRVDGITLVTGDRILIKNQSAAMENGIYIVNVSGEPSRASDMPINSHIAGKTVLIIEGTANADTTWIIINDPPNDIVGIDALTFSQTSKAGMERVITGPGMSDINRVAIWDNAVGTLLKQSTNVSINSTDDISGINSLKFLGSNVLTVSSATQTVGNINATIPNLAGVNDTFAMVTRAQTLVNKTLVAPTISSITNSGTITIPSGSDTLVARATGDTLTNKNITDLSNNVYANGLNTTGSPVVISGSQSATAGQILAASSATLGAWTYQGWRSPVLAASTSNVVLSSNLVGMVLDGVTLSVGNRILLKNQTTTSQNGIYIVNNGAGTSVRSSDMATGSSVSMVFFYCSSGSTWAGKRFVCTNIAGSDVVGTNNLTFIASINGPGSSSAGALVRWDGTSGSTLSNCGVLIDNSNNLSGLSSIVLETGAFTATILSNPQVSGASTIIIPDLSGAGGDMVINNALQTLTNKTLFTPIIDSILDTDSNTTIVLTPVKNAVNYINIANAIRDEGPSISPDGPDTDIAINIITKGNGSLNLKSTSGDVVPELRLYQNSSGGSNYVGLRAPASNDKFTTTSYTFPNNYGSNGQYLMSNGSGILSWSTPADNVHSMTNSVATYTTTSASYTTITSMTATPAAGTYYVMFNSSGSISTSACRFNYGIAVGGTVDANTVRSTATTGSQSAAIIGNFSTIGICTVNGSQAIDIRVLRASGTGTLSVFQRSLYLFKVA